MIRLREAGSSISRQYDILSFVFAVFLAGIIDAIVMAFFAIQSYDYLAPIWTQYSNLTPSQYPPAEDWISVIGFGVIVLFVTLVPPLLLSRSMGRVVPPLFAQMVALGWFLLIWSQMSVAYEIPAISYFVYVIFGFAIIQDELVLSLIGKRIDKRDMELHSLKIAIDPVKVKEVLMTPRIRKSLSLSSEVEQTDPSIILVERKKRRGFQIMIELSKIPNQEGTILNVAGFDQGKYSLRWSEDLQDYTDNKFDYIKGILSRYSLKYDDALRENAESLADYIENTMQATANKAVNTLGWPIFLVYVGGIVIPLVAGLVGIFPSDVGFGLTVTDVVIIAVDVRRKHP